MLEYYLYVIDPPFVNPPKAEYPTEQTCEDDATRQLKDNQDQPPHRRYICYEGDTADGR